MQWHWTGLEKEAAGLIVESPVAKTDGVMQKTSSETDGEGPRLQAVGHGETGRWVQMQRARKLFPHSCVRGGGGQRARMVCLQNIPQGFFCSMI